MVRVLSAVILLASFLPAKAFDVNTELDWLLERTKRSIDRSDREAERLDRQAAERRAKALPDLSRFGTSVEEASPRPAVPHRRNRVIECVTLNGPDQLGSITTCD